MAADPVSIGFGLPFQEQIDFFRAKLNLPTERWDDIKKQANDRAFIVAGAADADLLQDLREAVDKAITEGKGIAEFRKDFKRIVQARGWQGWTGQGTKAGEAWRTRIIYTTNLSTSYAAGRWKQLTDPDFLKLYPIWEYVHNDSVTYPRPLHVSWNGITLPAVHVFWLTHYTPNGWGCQCYIVPRRAGTPLKYPPAGWDTVDPKTGEYVGIDKGFGYAPGANANTPIQSFIDDKLIKLDAAIGAQLWQTIKPVLASERAALVDAFVSGVAESMQPAGEAVAVHTVEPAVIGWLLKQDVNLEDANVWLTDHVLAHALSDTRKLDGEPIPVKYWKVLPDLLAAADVYLDKQDTALIFASAMDGLSGKVVVRINYSAKMRSFGKRQRVKSNFVVTGGLVPQTELDTARYLKFE